MPSVEEHCRISLDRTKGKNDYRALHEWMDEPQKFLGINHRIERHVDSEAYREFIKFKWGEKAIVEWLFHIAIDNIVTAFKTSNQIYHTSYNYYRIALLYRGEIVVGFEKHTETELIRRFRNKKD